MVQLQILPSRKPKKIVDPTTGMVYDPKTNTLVDESTGLIIDLNTGLVTDKDGNYITTLSLEDLFGLKSAFTNTGVVGSTASEAPVQLPQRPQAPQPPKPNPQQAQELLSRLEVAMENLDADVELMEEVLANLYNYVKYTGVPYVDPNHFIAVVYPDAPEELKKKITAMIDYFWKSGLVPPRGR